MNPLFPTLSVISKLMPCSIVQGTSVLPGRPCWADGWLSLCLIVPRWGKSLPDSASVSGPWQWWTAAKALLRAAAGSTKASLSSFRLTLCYWRSECVRVMVCYSYKKQAAGGGLYLTAGSSWSIVWSQGKPWNSGLSQIRSKRLHLLNCKSIFDLI